MNTTFQKAPSDVVRVANDELMNDSESHDSLANAEQDDAKEMKAHEEKEKY